MEYRADFRQGLDSTFEAAPSVPVTPEGRRERIRHLSLVMDGDVIEAEEDN